MYARRAQHPNGGDAAPVHDAASGDDGRGDMLGEQRRQGEDADQALFRMADEGAAMTAGLGALRDDAIHAAFFQHDGFQHMGRRAQGDNPGIPQQLQIDVIGRPKGKTQGRYALLQQYVQLLLECGGFGGRRWSWRQSQFRAVRRQQLRGAGDVRGIGFGGSGDGQIDGKRPVGERADMGDGLPQRFGVQIAARQSAQPASVRYRRHQLWRARPARHGGLDDRIADTEAFG